MDQRAANAGAIVADLQTGWLATLADRYPDIDVAIEGQAASTPETGASIARSVAIGLPALYVILDDLGFAQVEAPDRSQKPD